MDDYISRKAVLKMLNETYDNMNLLGVQFYNGFQNAVHRVKDFSAADVAPVRHGRWILEAHNERVNYRWNVTAECSECCDEKKEIYAGFFPGAPDYLAKDVILDSAKSVKLSNYCPNCGARMDGGINDETD